MSGIDNSCFVCKDIAQTTNAGMKNQSAHGSSKMEHWDQFKGPPKISSIKVPSDRSSPLKQVLDSDRGKRKRLVWDNQIEFLMSCIATSVGLGNVWRFPFIAYQNGGGAFLIPYIIVLLLVGKPIYYLECMLGQFSSRNSVKIWALSPAMRGTGYAQTLTCSYILSYYMYIVAICIFYLAMSFQSELPWKRCDPAWLNCVPSRPNHNVTVTNDSISSAQLYFVKRVLQRNNGLEEGLGTPIWYLTLCLLVAWVIIFAIVVRGVKSSGKAAYFLALFPYVVMLMLFITTLLLDGASKGILFFITPRWDALLKMNVWYYAVTQVFFSLSVCTGPIVMFSSYNGFKQNVYRDAMVVTTLDTFTSLLSGLTIFGILGNLAKELNTDVDQVIGEDGVGLAFISYPDAIARTFMPQLFSVLFFLMMTVLGVGSGVALLSTINTVLVDTYPRVRIVYMSAICCVVGFLIGLVYVTPGGQYVLELVNHYGGNTLVLFCGISQVIGICWIYGLENICLDIEFMSSIKTSIFWRLCWGIITPGILLIVLGYALYSFENASYCDEYVYPTLALAAGYIMLISGILFIPTFIGITLWKNRSSNIKEMFKNSFHYTASWGPRSSSLKQGWEVFRANAKRERQALRPSLPRHVWNVLTGRYRRTKPTD